MGARKDTSTPETPDQIPLTTLQAARLSALTGVAAKELVGVRPVDLAARLRWIIDPHLFFYRRICGRVVNRDPVTAGRAIALTLILGGVVLAYVT